jgi:hypothetical protein
VFNFTHHPNVRRFRSLDAAVKALRKLVERGANNRRRDLGVELVNDLLLVR